MTTTETVPQPVTSLVVQSYGGQIQVTSAQVDRVHVTETISYDQGTEPAPVVAQSVSGGRLSLSDPTALPSITITSGGGSLQVEPPGGAG